jgi:hypothetical protein
MGQNALEIEGLRIFGTAKEKPVISLTLKNSSYDIGTIIDKLGIASFRSPLCSTYYDLL